MKNMLFLCDIDNTLIYSYKYFHEDWPCVEWIHDKEQAYMSPRTIAGIERINTAVRFVPVTSRSVEQYTRIRFPAGCVPEYAVVANGAELLKDGIPDPQWHRKTDRAIRSQLEELNRLYVILSERTEYIRCRMVDNAYLFVYCAADTDPAERAGEIASMTQLTVERSGKKIYILPTELNKGTALKRAKAYFGCGAAVAAGDSGMDLAMLDLAETAIMPEVLAPAVVTRGMKFVCPREQLFSEFTAAQVLDLIGGGK